MSTTLDKPVKTYLMTGIENAIAAITQIAQSKRGHIIPTDLDTAQYPFAGFFEGDEDKKQRNRITIKTFPLTVGIYVKKKAASTIHDQMDLIDAELEKGLTMDNAWISAYAMGIVATGTHRAYPDDDDETGMIVVSFDVTYSHAWKNPYVLEKG